MINLEPYRDSFRYRTAERDDVIEAKIYYDLGWSSRMLRGIYLRFVPMFVHADGHESYHPGSIARWRLLPLQRKSPKKLILIAEELDRFIPQMAADFKAVRGSPLKQAADMVKALFPMETANGDV